MSLTVHVDVIGREKELAAGTVEIIDACMIVRSHMCGIGYDIARAIVTDVVTLIIIVVDGGGGIALKVETRIDFHVHVIVRDAMQFARLLVFPAYGVISK